MGNVGGGVVYWRRVAEQLRSQADDAARAGDALLCRAPQRSNEMYRLACQMNVAARRVDRHESVTIEEHALIEMVRTRLESQL